MQTYDYAMITGVCVPFVISIISAVDNGKDPKKRMNKKLLASLCAFFVVLCGFVAVGVLAHVPSLILQTSEVTEPPAEPTVLTTSSLAQNTASKDAAVVATPFVSHTGTQTAGKDVIPASGIFRPRFGRCCFIQFGLYPQTADGEAKPILWRVVDVSEKKALVISEWILFFQSVVQRSKDPWVSTDLYTYLNTAFITDAFSDSERDRIMETSLGKMYLLSVDQANDASLGFADNDSRRALDTEFSALEKTEQHNAWWLLPDITGSTGKVAYVKVNGVVASYAQENTLGVRPVCLLNIGDLVIASGEGSKGNPFRFGP